MGLEIRDLILLVFGKLEEEKGERLSLLSLSSLNTSREIEMQTLKIVSVFGGTEDVRCKIFLTHENSEHVSSNLHIENKLTWYEGENIDQ
jgi:hypothetical protein